MALTALCKVPETEEGSSKMLHGSCAIVLVQIDWYKSNYVCK